MGWRRRRSDGGRGTGDNCAILTARMSDLTARIASAVVVDPRHQPRDAVRFGAMVTLRTLSGEHARESVGSRSSVSTRRRWPAAASPSPRRSLARFSDAEWGTPPPSTPLAARSCCRWCRSTTQQAEMAAVAWARGREDHMLRLRPYPRGRSPPRPRPTTLLALRGGGRLPHGLELAPRLLPGQSQAVIVIIALGLALLGRLSRGGGHEGRPRA